jgi:tRNA threonylcarbamoyladenosine biosynthesis protein TsaE
MQYALADEQATKDFGKTLAAHLDGGDIVALSGDLGAGKTTLVKGIAAGLGVAKDITSPTFTLMNVYDGSPALVHIDTYRLEHEQELRDIGVEDYLGAPDAICVIEWPEKLPTLLANKKLTRISLGHIADGGRKIVIS